MEQLLCEPEDRLGSQAAASVTRPDSLVMQSRRSGFIPPTGQAGGVDGAHLIKVPPSSHHPKWQLSDRQAHQWLRGIDWENIHRFPAPYRPELRNPEDTRHFDDDIPAEVSITLFNECCQLTTNLKPLAPANGAPANATRDPMLLDQVHGEQILNVRKALAFAGFTHKSPRLVSYVRADKAFDPEPDSYGQEFRVEPEKGRGRSTVREAHEVGRGRAISM